VFMRKHMADRPLNLQRSLTRSRQSPERSRVRSPARSSSACRAR
jgi:hypothetical protein